MFLPMVDRALRHRPEVKWFVFIDEDTYLIWSNLLEYLALFDPSKPYYIGKHMYIGNTLFAYGGAGFVVSNPTMRRLSEHRVTRLAEYDQFTARHWAGDGILGKPLDDIRMPLFWPFRFFKANHLQHWTTTAPILTGRSGASPRSRVTMCLLRRRA